jgi:hypothetical protein
MHEDLEARVALLVASLSPEEYDRFGPAVQELGLALAELRQVQSEDLDHAEERVHNAIRLWDDAE